MVSCQEGLSRASDHGALLWIGLICFDLRSNFSCCCWINER